MNLHSAPPWISYSLRCLSHKKSGRNGRAAAIPVPARNDGKTVKNRKKPTNPEIDTPSEKRQKRGKTRSGSLHKCGKPPSCQEFAGDFSTKSTETVWKTLLEAAWKYLYGTTESESFLLFPGRTPGAFFRVGRRGIFHPCILIYYSFYSGRKERSEYAKDNREGAFYSGKARPFR